MFRRVAVAAVGLLFGCEAGLELEALPPGAEAGASWALTDGGTEAFDDADAERVLAVARQQLSRTAAVMPATSYPKATLPDGTWSTVPNTDMVGWTQGFFPGSLWAMHQSTGDATWRTRANTWTRNLEVQKTNRQTHDLGFKMFPSFGAGYQLTGDPYYSGVLMTAAESLASRFVPNIGIIKCCDWNADWQMPLVVDTMMNLELLLWAAQNGGRSEWRDMALSHALKNLQDLVRPDGSTYHVVDYDPTTGAVRFKGTYQGYSDASTWTRGQAWAVYGYTMVYRYTRDARMLAAAQRTADYYLSRVGADMVPNWDFDAPQQSKDSSAAAIVASALLELSTFVADPALRDRYRDAAVRTLDTLASSAYLISDTSSYGILRHGVGNYPAGREVDVSLIYGDYYFIEAVLRFRQLRTTRAITFRSVWRYDDRNVDPGSQWRTATFDDSTWKSGAGQFGYGEGDETTVLLRTSPAQPSLYFRRHVTAAGPVTQATMRVIHDDGVAVWVNGTQVFGEYVANGTAHSTYASASSADNELDLVTLSPQAFREGDNVIAVMIKQSSGTSSDVSFDLELTLTTARPGQPTIRVVSPNGGEQLTAGQSHPITWTSTGAASTVRIEFSSDGGATWTVVSSAAPNTGQYTWTVPSTTTSQGKIRITDSANAALTDTTDGVFSIGAAPTTVTAIPLGSAWRYDDRNVDPGSQWRTLAFDDSTWPTGNAHLGYGDGDERTVLRRTSPAQPSVYFRRKIQVGGTVTRADLAVIHDDGVAVWVNGVQVFSKYVANGTGHSVYASAVSADNERSTATIPPSAFVQGENIVAVMVKQSSSTSSDLSFDLSLTLTTTGPTTPTLRVTAPNGGEQLSTGQSYNITWSSSGAGSTVRIELSTDGGTTWSVISAAAANSGQYAWTVPATTTSQGKIRVTDTSNAALTDTTDGVFSIGAAPTTVTPIPLGSAWRYDDRNVDPGSQWRTLAFDDSTWPTGTAQLGYGDGDERTVLRRTSPAQPSVYFRKKIQVTGAVTRADLTVIHDDGAAVWVNGVLVFSKYVANGTGHSVYASAVSADNERSTATLSPSAFVQGENIVAVMVKQSSGTSSDLSFDLSLTLSSSGSAPPTETTTVPVPFRSDWRFDDLGVDRGTSWLASTYDDSGWKLGVGQFGYGDGDEATRLRQTSPSLPSFYFRKRVTVNGEVTAAQLRAIFDDGVAVWINGRLVASRNMGNGTSYSAWASASSADNELMSQAVDLGSNPFVRGENVIAVMVKQAGGSSSDVSFDLELTLTTRQ